MSHPLIAAIEALPVFAWAHCARPEFVHHAVKDLWLKVSPQQVENYIEPLVLLEDVRSALNAALQPAPQLPTAWRYMYQGQWHLSDEMPGEGAGFLTPLFNTPAPGHEAQAVASKPEAAIEGLIDALEHIAFLGLDCPAAAGPANAHWYLGRCYEAIRVARLALDAFAETQRSCNANGSDEKKDGVQPALTDERIIELWNENARVVTAEYVVQFARAILAAPVELPKTLLLGEPESD